MHIKNEIWRVEIDKAQGVVRLYLKRQKRPKFTVKINDFIALGALISQVKGGLQ